ncbi:hypothetical protein T07_2729 [Trichinella nelsoni]|uniref:Uncharacterized protein n=1 Tax=Trichinella nelsoni TaxID=6336 RepID=A0A0V0RNZ5_9BILA|nr:hypothetical protein T07_2729 [Trichinella nelsoni]
MKRNNGSIEKKVHAKIPVQQLLCEKYATVTIVIGSHSQDCLHIMIFSFVELLKEISSFAVWNDWRKYETAAETNVSAAISSTTFLLFFAFVFPLGHLPTATMAVSTVNYMQYDSSPDVWNFDDQEKELSDMQLMALVMKAILIHRVDHEACALFYTYVDPIVYCFVCVLNFLQHAEQIYDTDVY